MITSPLAGAVIGYFTNWLAIRMLFRPYEEKKLGSFRLPFTPGLIPKEKNKLASKLGNAVADHLITQNAFLETLTSQEFLNKIGDSLEQECQKLMQNQNTLENKIQELLQKNASAIIKKIEEALCHGVQEFFNHPKVQQEMTDALFQNIICFLNQEISILPLEQLCFYIKEFLLTEGTYAAKSGFLKQPLEKAVWNGLLRLGEDERTLNQFIPYENIQGIKDYLSVKTPDIVKGLLDLTEDPEIETNLKKKLDSILNHFLGTFTRMLVNTDSIYEKIKKNLWEYFDSVENQSEIEEVISILVDRAMEFSLGSMAQLAVSELREFTIDQLIGAIINIALKEENIEALSEKIILSLQNQKKKKIKDFLSEIEPDYEAKLFSFLEKTVSKTCQSHIVEAVQKHLYQKWRNLLTCPFHQIVSYFGTDFCKSIKNYFFSFYQTFIVKIAPGFLKGINIPHMVETQIIQMDMAETEKIIFSIASRELRAITIIGGILGFVIGFIPVILQLLS